MIITHRIEMDLAQRGILPKISVVQGDSNTRAVELTLLEQGKPWTLPEDAVVSMRYGKPDGTKGSYDTLPDGSPAWTANGNVVTMVLAPQMLTVDGAVLAQLEMLHGTDVLATFLMQFLVERNPAAGVLQSEDYVNWLRWMEQELRLRMEEAVSSGDFAGPQGPQGPQGIPGPSVYEFAVKAGYTGTEAEFAAMLIAQYLPLDGSGTMTGHLDMGKKRISNLATPSANTDAANKSYVDGKRLQFSATLYSDRWNGAGPYTQTVLLSGTRSSDIPHVGPVYTGDPVADLAIQAAWADVTYAQLDGNNITFTCLERKPGIDIPVQMEVLH